mmetsp:Transcript_2076/g.6742  ORF Transcript_2076/g.6742 Transcript_2076/m.6742 type:complete len:242 (-) Transcript_2076:2017-2742(-)
MREPMSRRTPPPSRPRLFASVHAYRSTSLFVAWRPPPSNSARLSRTTTPVADSAASRMKMPAPNSRALLLIARPPTMMSGAPVTYTAAPESAAWPANVQCSSCVVESSSADASSTCTAPPYSVVRPAGCGDCGAMPLALSASDTPNMQCRTMAVARDTYRLPPLRAALCRKTHRSMLARLPAARYTPPPSPADVSAPAQQRETSVSASSSDDAASAERAPPKEPAEQREKVLFATSTAPSP